MLWPVGIVHHALGRDNSSLKWLLMYALIRKVGKQVPLMLEKERNKQGERGGGDLQSFGLRERMSYKIDNHTITTHIMYSVPWCGYFKFPSVLLQGSPHRINRQL